MSVTAILMLTAVWSIIGVSTMYCFYKLMTSPRSFDNQDE